MFRLCTINVFVKYQYYPLSGRPWRLTMVFISGQRMDTTQFPLRVTRHSYSKFPLSYVHNTRNPQQFTASVHRPKPNISFEIQMYIVAGSIQNVGCSFASAARLPEFVFFAADSSKKTFSTFLNCVHVSSLFIPVLLPNTSTFCCPIGYPHHPFFLIFSILFPLILPWTS